MNSSYFDVVVVGCGPAGLSAAIAACNEGSKVAVLDRESKGGGILKQCIHDGFGLERYNRRLSGPHYAQLDLDQLSKLPVTLELEAFVSSISRTGEGFSLYCSSPRGFKEINCKALIMATGCRERTSKQIAIHGTRPAGIFNAGTAQNLVNIHGLMPGRNIVILGSGDIGLIMARRLTLEGGHVIGVYEAKTEPSGLARNIHQCLEDFGIPLYLGTTVTRCIGLSRLEAVEIAKTDKFLKPIDGTQSIVKCDTLIVSVGLIAENELIKPLGVEMDKATSAPVTDQYAMTSIPGLFCTGNSRVVFDLVDTVSETSSICGKRASQFASSIILETPIKVVHDSALAFTCPQCIRPTNQEVKIHFRPSAVFKDYTMIARQGDTVIGKKLYSALRPAQMESIKVKLVSNQTIELIGEAK